MLKSAYLLAKIGTDTAENEQDFAELLTKIRQNEVRGELPLPLRVRAARRPDAARDHAHRHAGRPRRGQAARGARLRLHGRRLLVRSQCDGNLRLN